MSKNLIFLTGCEGFIGKNLLNFFKKNNINYVAPKFKELDLSDEEQLFNYVKDKKITHCIHSATTLRKGTDYPDNVLENNLRMFFNLDSLLPESVKLINFGSGSEYNRSNWMPKMKESFFGKNIPSDSHSYAKYLISKFISNTKSNRDMTTFRIFGIYGEGEDYKFKFISNLIAKVLCDINPVINQNAFYDYIDVQDFCSLCFKLMMINKTYSYDSINVCSGNSISLEWIAKKVIEITNKKNISYSINNSNLGREYSGCNERMKTILGENFSLTSAEETLTRLINFYIDKSTILDKNSLIEDSYMNYAKKIMKKI